MLFCRGDSRAGIAVVKSSVALSSFNFNGKAHPLQIGDLGNTRWRHGIRSRLRQALTDCHPREKAREMKVHVGSLDPVPNRTGAPGCHSAATALEEGALENRDGGSICARMELPL
jgi:hypothetical protein